MICIWLASNMVLVIEADCDKWNNHVDVIWLQFDQVHPTGTLIVFIGL